MLPVCCFFFAASTFCVCNSFRPTRVQDGVSKKKRAELLANPSLFEPHPTLRPLISEPFNPPPVPFHLKMGISINIASLLSLGPLLVAALPQALAPALRASTVLTQSGTVTGHPAKNATTVSEFLGIPYAQAPIGDLRFAAPASYESNQSFHASAFSPDCPQQGLSAPPVKYPGQTPQFPNIIDSFAGGRGNNQSEDCLTLNVWTKRPGSFNQTAVLVWLHGGRFTIGDSNTPFYDGEFLSESQDIVVVTINYRINVFGFGTAPGQPKNIGLLDQRKAIEWVRDNIGVFGGDPRKITIMGQSAGGSAVDYYAYAYAQDPIVAGLISHSGTAESFAANTPEYSAQIFSQAAQSLNCTSDNDEEVLACMRKVPYTDLLATNTKVTPLDTDALPQPPFHPTVDNITVFDLATYRSRGRAGQFAPIVGLALAIREEKLADWSCSFSHTWQAITTKKTAFTASLR